MTTTFLVPKNNANSKLSAAITAVATSLTLLSGEGARFPDTFPYHISIDNEILKVTARTTDTMTVERAKESTAAAAHKIGARVELNITAQVISDIEGAVTTLEAGSHSNSKDHDQNKDQYLDQGGANQVAVADVKDAVTKKHANTLDHSNSLDHSHSNKSTLDTYAQTEANLADAVSKKHSNSQDHANTNDPSSDQKAALAGTSGTPSTSNKYVTNADSRNSDARLSAKIINFTRDLSAASGDVAYTGVGFQPKSIIFILADNASAALWHSTGISDSAITNYVLATFQSLSSQIVGSRVIEMVSGSDAVVANVKSYDTDGFTLTYTRYGSPTGTANIAALCLR